MTNPLIDDPVFGSMKWNEETGQNEGQLEIGETEVAIGVAFECDSLEKILKRAYATFEFIDANYDVILNVVVDSLFETFNDEWNEGNPVSGKWFLNQLENPQINIYHNGQAEVVFDDGGMFAGHAIVVSIDENHQIDGEAEIHG